MIVLVIFLIVIGLYIIVRAILWQEVTSAPSAKESFREYFEVEIKGYKDMVNGKKSLEYYEFILTMLFALKQVLSDFVMVYLLERNLKISMILIGVSFIVAAIFLHYYF